MDHLEESPSDFTDETITEDEDSDSDYVPDEKKSSRHSRLVRQDGFDNQRSDARLEPSGSVDHDQEAESDQEMADMDEEDDEFVDAAEPRNREVDEDDLSEIFESYVKQARTCSTVGQLI